MTDKSGGSLLARRQREREREYILFICLCQPTIGSRVLTLGLCRSQEIRQAVYYNVTMRRVRINIALEKQ
jgi:hypothetical protein